MQQRIASQLIKKLLEIAEPIHGSTSIKEPHQAQSMQPPTEKKAAY